MTRWAMLFVVVASWAACKPLSATEVDAARKSPETLCKAVVATYRSQDLDAFSQLALSPSQVKEMMNKVDVPESAKRESIKNKGEFSRQVQDSLQTVLKIAEVEWKGAEFEQFIAQRKPIEIATGYKMHLGRMVVKVGGEHLIQPFNLVEFPDGRYFVGDFGPFEKRE